MSKSCITTKLKSIRNTITYKSLVYVIVFSSLVAVYFVSKHLGHDDMYHLLPQPVHKYLRFADNYTAAESEPGVEGAERLRRLVERLTYEECEIWHWKRFGPVERDTPIIVVQVGRGAARLQYLVASLAAVKDIRIAMLIFSHSYYDTAINRLIRAIDFCKVMQIFYPYSLQTHPDKFPGPDPNDCPATGAAWEGCVARDAARTEHKQHWWWQARHVFEGMEWAGTHRGMVLFVAAHSWFTPDALHMLAAAQRAFAYFPRALLVALGRPAAAPLDVHYDLLTVDAWRPPFHVGLAFNRSTWRRISALGEHFCTYDDCSWSYSLQHALAQLPSGHAEMLACVAPRVTCTQGAAMASGAARAALRRQAAAAARGRLFPRRVRAVLVYSARGPPPVPRPPRGVGGWADVRDQLFCIDPLMTTTVTAEGMDDAENATYQSLYQ